MKRRDFLKQASQLGTLTITTPFLQACSQTATASWEQNLPTPVSEANRPVRPPQINAQVAFVKTRDRLTGVSRALELLEHNPVKGKALFLKPNFNSADPAPGSTHNDTLRALIGSLHQMGANRLTIGDRSGMGDTRAVMQHKEIFRLAEELGCETLNFDDLANDDWMLHQLRHSHWQNGFAVARPVMEAEGIIQTCCLKTHRYGGDFTMSLKNSVGLVAKQVPGDGYNYMSELHGSPHQRRMIAEVNAAYQPDLIVLDGVEAFVDGGPAQGKKVEAQVILAGTDRIAIDAVGVALLRYFGTTPTVSEGPIFQQDQLARAVELGLGIATPQQIELITDDPESAAYAQEIRQILQAG